MAIAFTEGITDEDWERERITLPLHRAVAAFEDGRAVALAGAYPFDLTIPGGQLPCAGVTWVGVQPTHRRQGILRDLMRRQLEANGLKPEQASITDEALRHIARDHTREAGVRSFERMIGSVLRNVAVKIAEGSIT